MLERCSRKHLWGHFRAPPAEFVQIWPRFGQIPRLAQKCWPDVAESSGRRAEVTLNILPRVVVQHRLSSPALSVRRPAQRRVIWRWGSEIAFATPTVPCTVECSESWALVCASRRHNSKDDPSICQTKAQEKAQQGNHMKFGKAAASSPTWRNCPAMRHHVHAVPSPPPRGGRLSARACGGHRGDQAHERVLHLGRSALLLGPGTPD